MVENVIIMGAAGRDFHNFNVYFRGNPRYNVVCFTATQIPDIDGRRYPSELAGDAYPEGIPIVPDADIAGLIRENRVDLVMFAYSDISHAEVMRKASVVTASGADFMIAGVPYTMIKANRPVISVCAVRTGCGKSQTSREVWRILRDMGLRAVVIRHPMPYGDLTRQAVQRFEKYEDFEAHHCTIEEREEYEPVVRMGGIIYAGVDYARILERAEQEADVIIWDGGNNDTPFYRPDLHIVVLDPHRAGHELRYHPGETNLRMADVAVINKVDSANPEDVETVRRNIRACNAHAVIIRADSAITTDDPDMIRGKRVLVVEDGPTLTHGEMTFGAGSIAAERMGAREMVDPRPFLQGSLRGVFERYPHIGTVLPAMGYGAAQMRDLENTINAADCDLVISGTPIDLTGLLNISRPVAHVRYEYRDNSTPTLADAIREWAGKTMEK